MGNSIKINFSSDAAELQLNLLVFLSRVGFVDFSKVTAIFVERIFGGLNSFWDEIE